MLKGVTLTKAGQWQVRPQALAEKWQQRSKNKLHFQFRVPNPVIKALQLANYGQGRMWKKGVGNGTSEHLPRRRSPSPSGALRYRSKVKADHPHPNDARLVDEARKKQSKILGG
jgi:hypothetical protein